MSGTLLMGLKRSVTALAVFGMLSGCLVFVPTHGPKGPKRTYKSAPAHPVHDQHPGKGHHKPKGKKHPPR